MRLQDHMSTSGAHLFRWRSYILLAFVPFIYLAVRQGPQVEQTFGGGFTTLYSIACIAMVGLGEFIRIITVGFVPRGTSGRNVAGQVAEVLNTTGIYALVRNPLYLGNCLMYVGIALFSQSLGLGLVMALVLLPYYERIIAAEESFLSAKFGATYDNWTLTTPAFLPRLTGWVTPSLSFSWRTVVQREHASIYGAVLALYLIALGLHTLGPDPKPLAAIWHWLIGIVSVIELATIWIKLRTPMLKVENR